MVTRLTFELDDDRVEPVRGRSWVREPLPDARRSTAWMRASRTSGLNGLAM